ncbi:MAG: hypothetical protein IPG72_16260 [Ardenticatenales bacterium]|nr:hypothetical protein [Ardenticatenales bacterium]
MDGPEDARWYWAAPLLLDRRRDREGSERWLAGSTAFRDFHMAQAPTTR